MNVQLREPSADGLHQFISQASFWLPELITESAWVEHAPFGLWLVGALRPRSIVELGVHRGVSYFVLCQAVRDLQLATRCHAIDTWKGDEHAGYYGEDVYDAVCQHNRRYDGFSRLICSDFSDASRQFADGSVDLLHIDGCHTFEAVRRDFETWLPKLSERGVVMLHDTAEYGNGFGVHLLWEMLRARYPHFEFTHGHGLGVVGAGDAVPPQVRQLFEMSASSASSQMIRAAYERLGGFVGQLQQQARHAAQVAMLTQQVRDLESVASSYEASTSWRLTAPLRMAARLMRSTDGVAGELRGALRKVASTRAIAEEPAYRADHPPLWSQPVPHSR